MPKSPEKFGLGDAGSSENLADKNLGKPDGTRENLKESEETLGINSEREKKILDFIDKVKALNSREDALRLLMPFGKPLIFAEDPESRRKNKEHDEARRERWGRVIDAILQAKDEADARGAMSEIEDEFESPKEVPEKETSKENF